MRYAKGVCIFIAALILAGSFGGARLMDLGRAAEPVAVNAYIITKTLRTGQTYKWRTLSVVVRRVSANNAADRTDDTMSLVVRTAGYSQSFSMREYDSVYVGDYEIVVRDITPSGRPGYGRATMQLRYIPPRRPAR